LFWGILFTMASFMPYAILDKKSAYLDSRYFYVGSAGGGFILALIFDRIFTFFRGKNKIFYAVFCLICMMLFFGYIYKNYQWITRDVQRMILVAKERKSVLLSIRKLTPSGIEKPVYYITGNNFGYYGIPEVKVPFQQGFGYTLMVWNFSSGKIPLRLLRETFLWRIREEGYKEEGQKGFGYFYNLNTLKFYIEKGAVAPSQVIGLYYDCDKKILRDVTFETREALESSL